jgi:hypothetical protein
MPATPAAIRERGKVALGVQYLRQALHVGFVVADDMLTTSRASDLDLRVGSMMVNQQKAL